MRPNRTRASPTERMLELNGFDYRRSAIELRTTLFDRSGGSWIYTHEHGIEASGLKCLRSGDGLMERGKFCPWQGCRCEPQKDERGVGLGKHPGFSIRCQSVTLNQTK